MPERAGISPALRPQSSLVGIDEGDRVLHSRNFLGRVVRNFHAKFFFECHHEFDNVETIFLTRSAVSLMKLPFLFSKLKALVLP
jgi:hypothetical protein